MRESIHAVESVAKTIESAATLSGALRAMQRAGHPIHPALSKGMNALYGYTSDTSGVRHALIDTDSPAVSDNEALFMFGACASFCQYLLRANQS